MALLFLGEDPWLREYESCEKLYRDIMEHIMLRQQVPRTNDKYSQLSATIRLRLKQYNNEVAQLSQKLDTATKSNSITPAESERRIRLIEVLHSKGIQVQRQFDEQVSNKLKEDRAQLLGASSSSWENDEPVTSNQSVTQLLENQKNTLADQERGLENLSQIISRQKNIAHTISNEVDLHNDILSDLGNQMDNTDQRVRTETSHISVVDHKDKTCIYWVFIILLFISIIAVSVI